MAPKVIEQFEELASMKLMQRLKRKQEVKTKPQAQAGYFTQATSWADDGYSRAMVSRQRYQVAFFSMAGLAALLTFAVITLAPMQRTQLLVLHQNNNGNAWLSTLTVGQTISESWAATQASIAKYVIARESYDPLFYREQTQMVADLSSGAVLRSYEQQQDSNNPNSPIAQLGKQGYRRVTVHSVLLLDKAQKQAKQSHGTLAQLHENLAQVNYSVTTDSVNTGQTTQNYTALISWRYAGIPNNPRKQLSNWNGFTVMAFHTQAVNGVGDAGDNN